MRTNDLKNRKYVVLLIGVSKYSEESKLKNIPNVERNIKDLSAMFLNRQFVGIAENNLDTVVNGDAKSIKAALTDAVEKTKDAEYTLFVYYSGHGILSSKDGKLYLAASDTTEQYLDSDSVSISYLKSKLDESRAGRKVLVVDACHSGQIHNAMSSLASQINASIKDFEGVHFVSSASEYRAALFPKKDTDKPTYFTGALLDKIKSGIDNGNKYLSLGEIVDAVSDDFKNSDKNLPLPEQSSYKNAANMPFVKNMCYRLDCLPDAQILLSDDKKMSITANKKGQDNVYNSEWQKVLADNTIWGYYSYIEKYPGSSKRKDAEAKIAELEENAKWEETTKLGTILAYKNYIEAYPAGKYVKLARGKVCELRKIEEEKSMWTEAEKNGDIEKYKAYLTAYPRGIYAVQAQCEIDLLTQTAKRNIKILLYVFVLLTFIILFMKPTPIKNTNGVLIGAESYIDTNKSATVVSNTNSYLSKNKMERADSLVEFNDEMNFNAALVLYNEFIAENPNNSEALQKRAQLIKLIDKCFKKHLEDADAFMSTGLDFAKEDALNACKEALRLKPNDSSAILKYEQIMAE